jgi:hypothetical protein
MKFSLSERVVPYSLTHIPSISVQNVSKLRGQVFQNYNHRETLLRFLTHITVVCNNQPIFKCISQERRSVVSIWQTVCDWCKSHHVTALAAAPTCVVWTFQTCNSISHKTLQWLSAHLYSLIGQHRKMHTLLFAVCILNTAKCSALCGTNKFQTGAAILLMEYTSEGDIEG